MKTGLEDGFQWPRTDAESEVRSQWSQWSQWSQKSAAKTMEPVTMQSFVEADQQGQSQSIRDAAPRIFLGGRYMGLEPVYPSRAATSEYKQATDVLFVCLTSYYASSGI